MILTAVILWLVAFIFLIIIIKNVISRATKKKRCTATTNAVIKDVKERFITLMSTEYTPIISYTVDGTEYTCKYTKRPSNSRKPSTTNTAAKPSRRWYQKSSWS